MKDKDGVSALLLLCELAADAKAEGRTLVDILDDIALAHGLHATDQLSVRVTDLGEIAAAMARLRATPPTELGGLAVEAVDDLALGSADLPPTDGLRYRLADGARVIVRPSGTEPKLKCYLEVVVPGRPGGRRRRRPDRGRRPPGRAAQRHQGRRRDLGQTTSQTTNASTSTRAAGDLGPRPGVSYVGGQRLLLRRALADAEPVARVLGEVRRSGPRRTPGGPGSGRRRCVGDRPSRTFAFMRLPDRVADDRARRSACSPTLTASTWVTTTVSIAASGTRSVLNMPRMTRSLRW